MQCFLFVVMPCGSLVEGFNLSKTSRHAYLTEKNQILGPMFGAAAVPFIGSFFDHLPPYPLIGIMDTQESSETHFSLDICSSFPDSSSSSSGSSTETEESVRRNIPKTPSLCKNTSILLVISAKLGLWKIPKNYGKYKLRDNPDDKVFNAYEFMRLYISKLPGKREGKFLAWFFILSFFNGSHVGTDFFADQY